MNLAYLRTTLQVYCRKSILVYQMLLISTKRDQIHMFQNI